MPDLPAFAATLTADWQMLPPRLQIIAGVIAALALLLLVAWLSSRRARHTAEARAVAIERELGTAKGDLALGAERLAAREARITELQDDAVASRAQLAEVQDQRGELAAQSARRLEAVERLDGLVGDLREELAQARATLETLRTEHGQLKSDHSAALADRDEKLASAAREVQALKELREELTRKFEEVASATLRRTGADFEKTHTERLNALLTPFREHVGRFEEELRKVHGQADTERARLGEQIRMLTEKTEAIGAEAVNLTRALKGDKQKQGAWGEMILERLLEESGLIEGTHYDRQQSHTDESGARYRPDVIVRMPQGKSLVVDSKVSLVDYEAAVSAEDEATRTRHMKGHVAALRRHIDTLAEKGYALLADGSVDYVLMFIPIEGALSEAWRVSDDLSSYAAARKVGLVTPTTLMLALKTVDHIWTVEKRERNAEAIAARAGTLYDKFTGFVDDVEKIGRALDQAVRAKDDAMGKLSTGNGNLVRQAEMLRQLGAKTRKQLSITHDADDDAEDEDRLGDAPALSPEAAE